MTTTRPDTVFAGAAELPDVKDAPWTGPDIVAGLRRVLRESAAYWRGTYSDAAFFQRSAPDVWAPVDQVRHLTKSLRAIAKGFEIPRLLLALRFGAAFRPSREYHACRHAYDDRLRGRGIRSNPFAPRELGPDERGPAGRDRVMQQHEQAVERLCRALERYPEWSFDRLRARHPLLGMITMRELAMFALLHNVHHVHVAERRRAGTAG